MKKIMSLTAIVLLFSLSVTAQQRQGRMSNKTEFTPEQTATIQTKKMTLHLDLNDNQQKEIYDLNLKNAKEREKTRTEFQKNKQAGTPLTSNQRFERENIRLERQIAHKAAVKKILTEDQFEKWEKVNKSNFKKGNKKMGRERGMDKGDFQRKQFKNRN